MEERNRKHAASDCGVIRQKAKFSLTLHDHLSAFYGAWWLPLTGELISMSGFEAYGHLGPVVKTKRLEVREGVSQVWPAPQVLQWVASLAHAVRFLHINGMLHRNIKLSNIYMYPRGGNATGQWLLKLGDMGSRVGWRFDRAVLEVVVLVAVLVSFAMYICKFAW